MPKVILMGQDITQLVSLINWSGDSQQAARKLELGITASPTDRLLPQVTVRLGNLVKLLGDDDSELFRGYAFSKDKSSSNSRLTVTVYDGLIYLLKSKGTYNFKKMTAEQVTKKVAGDVGIPIRDLAKTGIPLSFIADSQSMHAIISQAYALVGKRTGKSYLIEMKNGNLNVVEQGAVVANFGLSSETNVTNSTYSESIEDMVNRVKIYDANGKTIGQVENGDWVQAFGVLQDVYKQEQGKDARAEASSLLKGIERSATLTALGNINCITGRAVSVREPFTGLIGRFIIETDQHTWQEGQHTMQLAISLQDSW